MTHEHILVVKRDSLFSHKDAAQGLIAHTQPFLDIINQKKEFKLRAQMEEDTNYKQIIPYLVFKHSDRYFLMQRRSDSSEQRLKNKYSLGIGGHMRQEDMSDNATIFDWAKREFHEEVSYSGKFSVTTIGILNDDSNPVSMVHLGVVLLIEGESSDIKVHSELKSGQLVTIDECREYYAHMESWSQIIFDSFINQSAVYKYNAQNPSLNM